MQIIDPDKPNILLTNDDGIDAAGMAAMREAANELGNLYVCAPKDERSASGHSITLFRDLTLEQREGRDGTVREYSLDGTPADCVKFALSALDCPKPDLVLSGINSGCNTGNNILNSGTVSAAIEARMYGIPALAVSISYDFETETPDFTGAITFIPCLIDLLLNNPLPANTILNVNVPNFPLEKIEGIEITRQGNSWYRDRFQSVGEKKGRPVYRNMGAQRIIDPTPGTDCWAIEHRRISILPQCYNMTKFLAIDELQNLIQNINLADIIDLRCGEENAG